MKKSTFLWIAILILFLINITTLLFVLPARERPGPPPVQEGNRRFDEQVIHTLQLSPEQVSRFEVLKEQHHREMMQLDDSTGAAFRQYFGLLMSQDPGTGSKDSLEQVIAALYREKVIRTYAHFEQLKAICSPQQLENFSQLSPSLMQVISPPAKNRDDRRRKME